MELNNKDIDFVFSLNEELETTRKRIKKGCLTSHEFIVLAEDYHLYRQLFTQGDKIVVMSPGMEKYAKNRVENAFRALSDQGIELVRKSFIDESESPEDFLFILYHTPEPDERSIKLQQLFKSKANLNERVVL